MSFRACFMVAGLAVCSAGRLYAEYNPPFELDWAAEKSQLVVMGDLYRDGELFTANVLEGDAKPPSVIRVGYWITQELAGAFDRHVAAKVIAFLTKNDRNGEWELERGSRGLVVVDSDNAYPFVSTFGFPSDDAKSRPDLAQAIEQTTFNRDLFIAALHRSVALGKERKRLLVQPRTPGRDDQLIELARRGEEIGKPSYLRSFWMDYPHSIREVAEALHSPSQETEARLMNTLRAARAAHDQVNLLELAAAIPCSVNSFDDVATYLDRQYPADVRRAAIEALPRIDESRAVDRLLPLLTMDEPQLYDVVRNFGRHPFFSNDQPRALNINAVAALEKLAHQVLVKSDEQGRATGSDNDLANLRSATVSAFQSFPHPRLVAVLMDRLLGDDQTLRGSVAGELQMLTGLKFAPQDRTSWEDWWRHASPVLQTEYQLRSKEGRDSWIKAWAAAETASRKILMNLWSFESDIDELALLEGAKTTQASRAVLSELWRCNRLSPEARRSIVQELLILKVDGGQKINGRSDFYIRGETEFDFPQNAWVEYRFRNLNSKNPNPALEGTPWNARSLNGDLSRIGGVDENPVNSGMIHAVLDIREVSFWPERRILWSVQKEVVR